MSWPEELALLLDAARGDLAVAVALMALRKVENGAPGRELGVLSVPAPTFQDQARVAANSLRHRERIAGDLGQAVRGPDGLYTEAFLRAFSARWAPLDAPNDPHGLNKNHADDLVALAARFGAEALESLKALV